MFAIRARKKSISEKDFMESVNKVGREGGREGGKGGKVCFRVLLGSTRREERRRAEERALCIHLHVSPLLLSCYFFVSGD